jgi:hypothetical protein
LTLGKQLKFKCDLEKKTFKITFASTVNPQKYTEIMQLITENPKSTVISFSPKNGDRTLLYSGDNLTEFYPNCVLKKEMKSVGIAMGYWLDGRGIGVRLPAREMDFSLLHNVQTTSQTHSASRSVGSRDIFSRRKAAYE